MLNACCSQRASVAATLRRRWAVCAAPTLAAPVVRGSVQIMVAMTDAVLPEAVERPAWRISFRLLTAIALGLALVAWVAGRYIYQRYGYRPLALVHVPPTMRYRARVELSD